MDFELYDQLQSLFVEIKKIEHVEQLLTETSRRYRSYPPELTEKSDAYLLIREENLDDFNRFVTFINDRAGIAPLIAKASAEAMPIINQRLGPNRTREIEEDMIAENIRLAVGSEEEAVRVGRQFFPNFSEAEIREIYRRAKEEETIASV